MGPGWDFGCVARSGSRYGDRLRSAGDAIQLNLSYLIRGRVGARQGSVSGALVLTAHAKWGICRPCTECSPHLAKLASIDLRTIFLPTLSALSTWRISRKHTTWQQIYVWRGCRNSPNLAPRRAPMANGRQIPSSIVLRKNSPPSDNRETTTNEVSSVHNDEADTDAGQPLSKNQLKRLRKQQQWQEYKEDRRSKRKDKRHERQARKRAEKEAKIAEAEAAGIDPATVLQQKEPWKYRPVPVSFIIDCDFEQYMREQELVSLSSQLVRSYAMNRKSKYQASLHFSSWKGKLKDRFETVLKNTHHNWKNVGFHEGDFKEAAKQAGEQMAGPNGGEMLDLIKPNDGDAEANPTVEVEPEGDDIDRSVVYLTSESPFTLDRLEANTSYVIGGIVDKNREKGLC